MVNQTPVTLDLNFFLSSILVNTQVDKRTLLKSITNTTVTPNTFSNLYDLLEFAQQTLQHFIHRIDTFTSEGGTATGLPFPYLDQAEEKLVHLVSLLQYADVNLLKAATREIQHDPAADLALIFFQDKLALAHKNKNGQSLVANNTPVYVDFVAGSTAYRINSNVRSETAVKAVISKQTPANQQVILDATAGFGQDSMLFANTGASILMLERNPVIALLLADGLSRLKATSTIPPQVSLLFPVSITNPNIQKQLANSYFNAVYLDPMYPHKNSTAKVNKNMQLIQQVVGSDADADDLLIAAQKLNVKRIVVKRPKGAPYLANQEVKDAVTSKSHRFDIYTKTPTKITSNFSSFLQRPDLLAKLKPENNTAAKAVANPRYTHLLTARQQLHHNNLSLEGLYGEHCNYHTASVGYSQILQMETILARPIDYQTYLLSKAIYSQNDFNSFAKALPGELAFRNLTFRSKPGYEDKSELIANLEAKHLAQLQALVTTSSTNATKEVTKHPKTTSKTKASTKTTASSKAKTTTSKSKTNTTSKTTGNTKASTASKTTTKTTKSKAKTTTATTSK